MDDQRTFLSLFSFEKLLPFDEKMHNFGARRVTACVIENSDTHIATFYVLHGVLNFLKLFPEKFEKLLSVFAFICYFDFFCNILGFLNILNF